MQAIKNAMADYVVKKRTDWVKDHPGQSILCVSQLYWTIYVHEAIKKDPGALAEYCELNNTQIDDIVELVRGKLSKQNRVTLGALVVLDVHARDVLKDLCEKGITPKNAFSFTISFSKINVNFVAGNHKRHTF